MIADFLMHVFALERLRTGILGIGGDKASRNVQPTVLQMVINDSKSMRVTLTALFTSRLGKSHNSHNSLSVFCCQGAPAV